MNSNVESFALESTILTPFVFANWFFAAFCFFWICFLFYSRRYLFIKPSMFLLVCTHFFFQIPLAVYSGFFEIFLPNPLVLSFSIHSYLLLGLLWSSWTLDRSTREVWGKVTDSTRALTGIRIKSLWPLVGICGFTMISYFLYVPISHTGIYAILFNPKESDLIREQSFNALPNLPRYSFQFFQAAIAPFTLCVLALLSQIFWKRRFFFRLGIILAAMLVLLACVTVTGARYPLVKAVLAILIMYGVRRGLPFYPIRYLVGIFLLLIPAAMFTILREGKDLGFDFIFLYLFKGIIVHRIMIVPLQVGAWHLHYSQLREIFGASAIPKLASLLHVESLAVPRLIGALYVPNPNFVTYSCAGYLLTYVSYFGLIALPLCIILMMSLDSFIFAYLRMSRAYLLATIATVSIAILELVQSDFTTVLISQGLLLAVVLGALMSFVTRPRKLPSTGLVSPHPRAN